MDGLSKIREVSLKYRISARALTYYEDMGLIQSVKSDAYAYRLYDEANIKRLEQILILRKLHISIKDIKRILDTSGSETVLEVLGRKVNDIDEEVALLQELKEIVFAFIRRFEQADFNDDSDVKSLYNKAKGIEAQLVKEGYTGNPSPAHRLFEVTDALAAKAVSRLQIPGNVLKRLLENVYFVFGDGADVADELGRRYGIFVYHTCDYRYKHHQNAAPEFQPEMCREVPDFFALAPENAMRHENAVVHDYTPMVIMDLIQLLATHERVICENAIDVDSIIQMVTHAVEISNDKNVDKFIGYYENEIRRRDISEDEKERLICEVNAVWRKGNPENPHGVKQIVWQEDSTVAQTADIVAEYFGLLKG